VALAGSLVLLGDPGVMVAKMVVGFTNAMIAFLSPAIFVVAITGIWKLAKPS
jgi:xanthosine utilization system XapX-like protein